MIDFSLDGDTTLIVQAARRYAQAELAPQQRAFEAAGSICAPTWQAAAEMGLLRACWRDEHGGSGLGWGAWIDVLSEIAQGDAAAAVAIDSAGAGYDALWQAGHEAWVREFLALEPGAHGAQHPVVVHDLQGRLTHTDAGRIDGVMPWVSTARADLVVVVGATGVHVVREGFTLEPVSALALQGAGSSRLRFEQAPVAASQPDASLAESILARSRLRQAAILLGVLQAASVYAREYALQRVAFGKPIAHHQALAFLLVDMNSAAEQTRSLVQLAACRLDAGDDAIEACNQAFIQACDAGHFVGPNAVQILGAAGFMRDYPVEKFMRELTALALALGGADATRDTLNRQVALPASLDWLPADAEVA
ncbi:acyl-CoA dehydrogenase family protein [Achromobacter sp. GG226]|uniref:acyl-CoA dehydrogenase family protein n=1 Tax=Verticiella alkaliphila TaxID=2779529 RepID=UPI001C0E62CC|nr:acyl-CoA dehydrogenase family protein [Verticiella sp. GG226]MBU4611486.1 acyl-CoA dehydrogenase family protein [Verticiella sp. GG226]